MGLFLVIEQFRNLPICPLRLPSAALTFQRPDGFPRRANHIQLIPTVRTVRTCTGAKRRALRSNCVTVQVDSKDPGAYRRTLRTVYLDGSNIRRKRRRAIDLEKRL